MDDSNKNAWRWVIHGSQDSNWRDNHPRPRETAVKQRWGEIPLKGPWGGVVEYFKVAWKDGVTTYLFVCPDKWSWDYMCKRLIDEGFYIRAKDKGPRKAEDVT